MENSKVIDSVINSTAVINNNYYDDSFKYLNEELRSFFNDQNITDIMINGLNSIYIEKKGTVTCIDSLLSEQELYRLIDSIAQYNSRSIDINHPVFDGKMNGGIRCNVVMPPISIDGVTITLRKHINEIDSWDVLIKNKMLDDKMAEILKKSVDKKLNLIVSGGTGTGKTTLINVLLNGLCETTQRVITIEDTAELRLKIPHVIRLESRRSTPDCPYEVSIRELVKTALRMRPDRIVIGEVRGEEAYDLLHAVNTGHRGCLCSIHANSCRDVLRRFETLAILGHPNLDISVPRTWIASNIHLIVHLSKEEGVRKIVELKSIEGVECGNYILHDLI
ncbi:MAG: ATPase, T2SS/T4P/T4SS family [bacterium]